MEKKFLIAIGTIAAIIIASVIVFFVYKENFNLDKKIQDAAKNNDYGPVVENATAVPGVVGDCVVSIIAKIDKNKIEYGNKLYQVFSNAPTGVKNSKEGDKVNFCWIDIPKTCNEKDSGNVKFYDITNFRTGEGWKLADTANFCGN